MGSSSVRRCGGVRGKQDDEERERPGDDESQAHGGQGSQKNYPPEAGPDLRLSLFPPVVQDVVGVLHEPQLHRFLLHREHGKHVAHDGYGFPFPDVMADQVGLRNVTEEAAR